MSVIADVSVPSDAFAFGEALAAHPDLTIRLERVVPLGQSMVPYFWAADDDEEIVEELLRTDSRVETLDVVDRLDGEILVKVGWTSSPDDFFHGLAEANATILRGTGTGSDWSFRLRFDDYDDLNVFYRWCTDRDVPIDLRRIHNPAVPEEVGLGLGLTNTQRETLLRALEAGYFAVPREINLVELADELGVSDTAVSQRIRRGLTALIEASLRDVDATTDDDSSDEP
jgi:predicted DNA binding protein